MTEQAIRGMAGAALELGRNSPENTAPLLKNFYAALYAGTTNVGGNISRPKTNIVRVGVFGDSVGGAKPQFIIPRLRSALGTGGGFFTSTATAPALMKNNINDCSYFINGSWGELVATGTIEYLVSGGRPSATTLKIYYIKESGAGTFKVQTNSGSGYADEASYTNVSAADATTSVGIITITKAAGDRWSVKLVGLTGTVRILRVAYLNAAGGLAYFPFDTGGLRIDQMNQTPAAIFQAVMADIDLDLAFFEIKDPDVPDFETQFQVFMANYIAANANTDWVLIGTTPQGDTNDANNVRNNAALKRHALENGYVYFDSYSPLTFTQLTALGWQGDGVHLSVMANGFYASLLWDRLGFSDILGAPTGQEFSASGQIPALGSLTFRGETYNGGVTATFQTDVTGSDMEVSALRAFVIKSIGGTRMGAINANGTFASSFGVRLGLTDPFSSSGLGIWNVSNVMRVCDMGANTTLYGLNSLNVRIGSTTGPIWLSGAGTPEGVVTAPVGSIFSRTDGGAGSTLYVKESGAGNTGWVAK